MHYCCPKKKKSRNLGICGDLETWRFENKETRTAEDPRTRCHSRDLKRPKILKTIDIWDWIWLTSAKTTGGRAQLVVNIFVYVINATKTQHCARTKLLSVHGFRSLRYTFYYRIADRLITMKICVFWMFDLFCCFFSNMFVFLLLFFKLQFFSRYMHGSHSLLHSL